MPENPKEELFKKIDSKENSLRKKKVAASAAPISSKPLKYPENLKSWKTKHFCQYHSENRAELDVLTNAFYSNVPGGVTLPLMTNVESRGTVGLHQCLSRIAFPVELYADLIQNTREVNIWKKNGISWEDVEKNVTAFRGKRQNGEMKSANDKAAIEAENEENLRLLREKQAKAAKQNAKDPLKVEENKPVLVGAL